MVQTQKPMKRDHNVIRQLLSSGAQVPPPSVFRITSDPNKQFTAVTNAAATTTVTRGPQLTKQVSFNAIDHDACSSIIKVLELTPYSSKHVSEFTEIDSSELFPEIGLPLADLDDIDQMVSLETTTDEDFNKNILSIPECYTTVSQSESLDVLGAMINTKSNDQINRDINMEDDGTSEVFERQSPMLVSFSSDSEVNSPPSPMQEHEQPSTVRVNRSYVNNQAIDLSMTSEKVEQANLPIPAIPLTALALAEDEEAQGSQLILQQLEEKYPAASSSSDVNISDEEEVPTQKTVRRKWTGRQEAASNSKRGKKQSSVSSEQDVDEYDSDEDNEDDGRTERRRHNNRVAAQRCRQRKRKYYLNLTKEIQEWECNNTTLKYEIHTLQKELQNLQEVLQEHQNNCSVDPSQLKTAANKSKKKSKKRTKSHKHRH